MGAKPSSAVQQSAYLEALDQYIDLDYDSNVRKCLLDKDGNRLLDSNGSPKTLRHKFAVYCDDMTGMNTTMKFTGIERSNWKNWKNLHHNTHRGF